MDKRKPIEGGIQLHCAQLAIENILDSRLVQQQRGDLRKAVNARILIEFIHQMKGYEAEWVKQRRIKESILRLPINTKSEQDFVDRLGDLSQKIRSFTWELEMGLFAVSRKSSVSSSSEQESLRSLESVDSEIIPSIFDDAFDRNIKTALEGVEKEEKENETDHRLGAILVKLWRNVCMHE